MCPRSHPRDGMRVAGSRSPGTGPEAALLDWRGEERCGKGRHHARWRWLCQGARSAVGQVGRAEGSREQRTELPCCRGAVDAGREGVLLAAQGLPWVVPPAVGEAP